MSDLLNSASLVMVPSGYKEDTVYSVVPSDGSGDLAFTRASNGTRVNSAGLVEDCPWNLATDSEDFTSGWPVTATITANTTANPINGAINADTITGTGFIGKNIASIGVNTFFVYAKANSASVIRLNVYDGSTDRGADYNLLTGAISGIYGSPISTNAENVGNGWWKISITTNNANYSYVQIHRDSSGTCYIWGAQLNIGSTAKPYFPTTDRLNVPRLTYQNGGGGCPSLLLEKQSTNIVNYSEQFDNANWQKENLTVTANSTTSPDGTQNADSFIENSLTASHQVYQGATVVAGAYSASVFMKKNTRQYGFLQIATDGAANRYTIVLDLDNGSVTATSTAGSPTGTSYKIDSMGNGWYRMTVTATHTSGEVYSVFGLSNSANPTFTSVATPTYTGNGTSGLYAWGAQLEASSYPTSYIPTTSSSATRVADNCKKTGISSLFGTNQGTFFIDFLYVNSETSDYIFDVTSSGVSQRFLIFDGGSSSFAIYDSTVGIIAYYTLTKGQRYKIAVKYNSTATYWYINGVLVATGGAYGYQMSDIYLGQRYTEEQKTQMQVNQTIIFPTALSGTDLIALTTI